MCACGIERKCVHAAEDAGSAEEKKENNQKERMRQRETVIWKDRV